MLNRIIREARTHGMRGERADTAVRHAPAIFRTWFGAFLPLIAGVLIFGGGVPAGGAAQETPIWFHAGRNTFNKSVLMVSNIRFCRERIAEDEEGPPELDGFGIIPLPDRNISKSRPAIVYYEIFNLQADSLENVQYRVQFVVQQSALNLSKGKKKRDDDALRSPEIFLSLEHQITSKQSHQINYTQVDLTHLEEGRYEFMIIVSDLNASQNAVGQVHFELMP